MTSFTKGPWDWDAGDDGVDYSHPYCTIHKDGGNLIIAEVNDRFDLKQGRANARLIAAAPENHTANQAALMVLCAIRDSQSWDKNMLEDIDYAIEACRAALEKAGP